MMAIMALRVGRAANSLNRFIAVVPTFLRTKHVFSFIDVTRQSMQLVNRRRLSSR